MNNFGRESLTVYLTIINMKTFYFIAEFANASSNKIKMIGCGKHRGEAFASIDNQMANAGYDIIDITNVNEDQYNAASLMACYNVTVMKAAITESPVNPV